jgi:hypothetical protein
MKPGKDESAMNPRKIPDRYVEYESSEVCIAPPPTLKNALGFTRCSGA